MKTWEMIKELTENPKKAFMRNYDELIVKIDKTTETLSWESGYEHLCIDDEWTEIKQPVTWQEALQALADGEAIRVEIHGEIIKYRKDYNTGLIDAIKKGEWYINE